MTSPVPVPPLTGQSFAIPILKFVISDVTTEAILAFHGITDTACVHVALQDSPPQSFPTVTGFVQSLRQIVLLQP